MHIVFSEALTFLVWFPPNKLCWVLIASLVCCVLIMLEI